MINYNCSYKQTQYLEMLYCKCCRVRHHSQVIIFVKSVRDCSVMEMFRYFSPVLFEMFSFPVNK